jgi:hypothetical protein
LDSPRAPRTAIRRARRLKAWQATGWRLEDRYQFVRENGEELWAEFSAILNQPVDPSTSWFGPRSDARPERPMQVGYSVGMQICETYYDATADKSEAIEQIYGAYQAEHFEAILAPCAERMGR